MASARNFTVSSNYTKYDVYCPKMGIKVTMVNFQMTLLTNKFANIVMDNE